MTLEFLDLYNECAGQPWSMFDNDAESIEDLESALKISINKAVSFLWNYQPWSFRVKTHIISTRPKVDSYNVPDGLIIRKVKGESIKYSIKCDGARLELIDDPDKLENESGEPTGFYIEGEKLHLYPIPDSKYIITIEYLALPYAISAEDDYIYELKEEDDRIDIPEKYEKIFSNCVISLAMMYAIADESDENYSGYKKQYEDALSVLFEYCRDKSYNRKIIW